MTDPTPGPWKVEEIYEGHLIQMDGSNRRHENHKEPQHLIIYDHGLVYDPNCPEDPESKQFLEAESNAWLISAAPDLLSACRSALRWIARNTPLVDSDRPILGPVADEADEIRAELRAAIAKAEGRKTASEGV